MATQGFYKGLRNLIYAGNFCFENWTLLMTPETLSELRLHFFMSEDWIETYWKALATTAWEAFNGSRENKTQSHPVRAGAMGVHGLCFLWVWFCLLTVYLAFPWLFLTSHPKIYVPNRCESQ